MNDKLNIIFKRRSVRTFINGKKLTEAAITDILEAAMSSPTARNKRPQEFIVVDDLEILKKISEILPFGKFMINASIAIVVCGDIDIAHDFKEGYLIQDCSASIQNILLASTALGFGSCWVGVYPNNDRISGLKTLFKLEDNIIPVGVAVIGYPDETHL